MWVLSVRRFAFSVLLMLGAMAVSADSAFLSDDDRYFVRGERGLCGFHILGNHLGRKVPRPEWDINIDGVPMVAKIVATPNSYNAVRALMEAEPATRLFEGFYTGKLITISLTYPDGATDVLQIWGVVDKRKFGGGRNNYWNECMRGVLPRVPCRLPVSVRAAAVSPGRPRPALGYTVVPNHALPPLCPKSCRYPENPFPPGRDPR
jgi:hypothetical protein